jgi:hypothetical protein
MPVINGIAYWASIQKPNTKFEPKWCIDVVVSKDEAEKFSDLCKSLKETGKETLPKITKDEEKGGFVIRFEQKVARADGSSNNPPRIINADGEPFTDLVGNGSKVDVLYSLYKAEYKGKTWIKPGLRGVKILDLVKFSGATEEEDFYKSSGSSKVQSKTDDDFDDEVDFN